MIKRHFLRLKLAHYKGGGGVCYSNPFSRWQMMGAIQHHLKFAINMNYIIVKTDYSDPIRILDPVYGIDYRSCSLIEHNEKYIITKRKIRVACRKVTLLYLIIYTTGSMKLKTSQNFIFLQSR